ncbi:MAG TPA: BlaI/MecI/CopY family transcriptional regulator, partial [Phenylobacterium sp.]
IASRREAGRAIYEPLVSREDYVTGESQGLLDRLFDGELAPLVAHYARHRALSSEEVTRLKRLIAELDADDQ